MSDEPTPAAPPLEDDDLQLRIHRLRHRHISVLVVSFLVIVAACVLRVHNEDQVAIGLLPQFPLPELCATRTWLGIRCPGCGLTRSFVHLAQGNWQQSVAMHPVGWVFAGVIVLQIPYRIWALRQTPVGGLFSRWPGYVGYLLIAMLIGNWLWWCATGNLRVPQ